MPRSTLLDLPPPGDRRRYLARLSLAAAAYALSGHLALDGLPLAAGAPVAWLPAGIGLFTLVAGGIGYWPAVLLGALWLEVAQGAPALAAGGEALGAALGLTLSAMGLRRIGFRPALDGVRDALVLVPMALLAATVCTAVGGAAASLTLPQGPGPGAQWLTRWGAEVVGMLVATPLLLAWARPLPLGIGPWRTIEGLLLAAALVGVDLLVFPLGERWLYAVFPVVFWIAFRYGLRGASTAVALSLPVALWYAGGGAVSAAEGAPAIPFQLFFGVLSASSIVFAVALEERARSAARMMESESLLRALFERTAVGVALADPWGRFVHANRAYLDLLGYTLDELRAVTLHQVTHSEDAPALREALSRLVADHTALVRLEVRCHRRDGTVRWVRTTASPIPGEDGGLRLVVAIVEDITEGVAAREELRWLEEANRELVERAPLPIYRATREGRVVLANPALAIMLGYDDPRALRELDLARDVYVRPEDRNAALLALDQGRDTHQAEVEWKRRDGSRLWVEVRARGARGTDGTIRSVECTVVDVTARRKAERLVEAFNRTSRLLGGILEAERLLETVVPAVADLVEARGGWSGRRTPAGMAADRYYRDGDWIPLQRIWPAGEGVAGRILATGSAYLNPDAGADPLVDAGLRETVGVRSVLAVAIPGPAREPIGFLEVHDRRDGRGFTPWDQELLGTVAEAVGLALRSALSFERLREARTLLEGEKEILEELARGAPLPAVLGRICRLLEQHQADTRASVLLLDPDGNRLRLGAAPGLPEDYNRAVDGLGIGLEVGCCGRAAYLGVPALTEDIAADPRWAGPGRALALAAGLRSCWSTPILSAGGTVLGTFALYGSRPGHPAPELEPVVARMSHLAGLAIERAHGLEALERRTLELQESEERYRLLAQHLPSAAVFLFDGDLRCLLAEGPALGRAALVKEAIEGRSLDELLPPDQAGVLAARMRDALQRGPREFEVEFRGRVYRNHLLALTEARSPAALGMILSVDITEEREHEAVRRRLFVRLMRAQEEERARIAREIHDEAGQALTAILVGLRMLRDSLGDAPAREQAGRLHGIVKETMENLSRLARGLHPAVLGDHGLRAALERHLRDYAGFGITTRLETRGFDQARLPGETEIALYRIIQEALTNVARHSGAREARVRLERDNGWVEAVVSDDGRGFETDTLLSGPGHAGGLGLHSIRERTTVLGGSFAIESRVGGGTTVRVRLPVPG